MGNLYPQLLVVPLPGDTVLGGNNPNTYRKEAYQVPVAYHDVYNIIPTCRLYP